jgi:hypothetical protein
MKSISAETCDLITIRLSGLIGVFDLLTDVADRKGVEVRSGTMVDFAFYIAAELKSLYKEICGVDYDA